MFKIIAFARKKPGFDAKAFKTHYEEQHVPIVCAIAPPPGPYRRNYVRRGDAANVNESDVDFDVMTEMVFPNREHFELWFAALTSPQVGQRVDADLASFTDLEGFRVCVVDMCGDQASRDVR